VGYQRAGGAEPDLAQTLAPPQEELKLLFLFLLEFLLPPLDLDPDGDVSVGACRGAPLCPTNRE
jgi:hypothetical protein